MELTPIRELLYEIKDFEIYDKASMPEKIRAIKGEYIGMWKLKESYFKKRKLGDHSSEYNNYKLEHSDN